MKKLIYEGSGVAIVTPFAQSGEIDWEAFERLIEFQIAGGTKAIVACGTTGEAATLSEEEHVNVIKFVADKVNKRVPVIASTGSNDTMFAVELSKEAEKIGVEGLLLVTPYYNKTSQKGLVESFSYIADSTNVPAIVYNVPSRTTVDILPETYLELSKHPNIVGVKEASPLISRVAETLALCGDSLAIYSGDDVNTLPMMALGGKGVISVFANILPQKMNELCENMLKADYAGARALLSRHIKLMDAMFADVNPIPVKQALEYMGYCQNKCRMPLTDMTDSGKEKLKTVLAEYNLV